MPAVKLHHRVTGEGEPLLLLHGLFGSLESLGGLAQRLATDFQIHALDLRNHGRSPHTPGMSYPEMAADLLAYLDAQGLARAHLLGHSMGGKAAMALALMAPERVARLLVLDIAPVRYPPHHDAILQGLQALPLAQLQSRDQADTFLKDYVPETPVRQFLIKNLYKTAEGHFQWRLNLAAIVRNYAHLLEGQEQAQAFDGPTLFIKGGASDYLQPLYRGAVLKLFPQADMRVIPGAGHWLHAEKPDLVATQCRRFFQGAMQRSWQQ